jgi:tetratricopeptide (TPR) repeat protein
MRALRYARLLAGVWLCATLLAGCAHRTTLMEAGIVGLPARVELADTPFFPQTRYQCGPAALATVLNARGVTIAPDELVPQVYLPGREGSLQAEIIAAVRRQGLLAVAVEPALDALLAEIAAGHPVLVLQNLGLNWLPRWHYAVVVGYDLARQEIVLRSGTEPRRITPFGVFLNTWNRSARWGVVVLAPGAFPAQAKPKPYLEAASALESLGKWNEAGAAYRASAARWPDNPLAWLGLGNTEYALGRAEPAEAAFRHALHQQAGAAVVWNNLAYALAARQCMHPAREAARCAMRIGSENTEFAHTLKEMESLPGSGAGTCLPLPSCPAH